MLRLLLVTGLFAVLLVWGDIQPGYLDFDNLPETNFSCEGKVIGGYYADVETGCQMFHVCTIGQKGEVSDIKFLCLNGTVFDQETRVCERIDEVDCDKSESFFGLNLQLYGNTAHSEDARLSDCEDCEDEEEEEVEYEDEEDFTTTTSTTTTSTTTTTQRPSTTTYQGLAALLAHHATHYSVTTRRPSINLSLRTKFSAEGRQPPTFRPYHSPTSSPQENRQSFRPFQPTSAPQENRQSFRPFQSTSATPLRSNYHHFSSGDTQFTHSFDPDTPYHFQYFKSSPSPFQKVPQVSVVTSTSTSTSVKVSNSTEFDEYDVDPFFHDVPKLRSKRSTPEPPSLPAQSQQSHDKHPNHRYPISISNPLLNHNLNATINVTEKPDFVIKFDNDTDSKIEFLENLLNSIDLEQDEKEKIGEIIKEAEPEVESIKPMGMDMVLETLENRLMEFDGTGTRDKRDQTKEFGRAKRESLGEIRIYVDRQYDPDITDPSIRVYRVKRDSEERRGREIRRRLRVRVKDNDSTSTQKTTSTNTPQNSPDIKPVTEEIEDDVTTIEYRRSKHNLNRPREFTTVLPQISAKLQTRYDYDRSKVYRKRVQNTATKSTETSTGEEEAEASDSDEVRIPARKRVRTETFIQKPSVQVAEEVTENTTPFSRTSAQRGRSRVGSSFRTRARTPEGTQEASANQNIERINSGLLSLMKQEENDFPVHPTMVTRETSVQQGLWEQSAVGESKQNPIVPSIHQDDYTDDDAAWVDSLRRVPHLSRRPQVKVEEPGQKPKRKRVRTETSPRPTFREEVDTVVRSSPRRKHITGAKKEQIPAIRPEHNQEVKEHVSDNIPEIKRQQISDSRREQIPEIRLEHIPGTRRDHIPAVQLNIPDARREHVAVPRRKNIPSSRREHTPQIRLEHVPETRLKHRPLVQREPILTIPNESPSLSDYSQIRSIHEPFESSVPVRTDFIPHEELTHESKRDFEVETTTVYPFYEPKGVEKDPNFTCKGKRKGQLYADVYADCLGFFICSQAKRGLRESHFWCGEGTRFSSESGTCVSGRLVKCGGRLIPHEPVQIHPDPNTKQNVQPDDHSEVIAEERVPVQPNPHGDVEEDPDFSCTGKVKGGHYADIYSQCRGFFICTQGKRELKGQHFWCGPGTKFNQKTLTCQNSRLVNCSQAHRFFWLDASPGLLDVDEEDKLRGGFEPVKT